MFKSVSLLCIWYCKNVDVACSFVNVLVVGEPCKLLTNDVLRIGHLGLDPLAYLSTTKYERFELIIAC